MLWKWICTGKLRNKGTCEGKCSQCFDLSDFYGYLWKSSRRNLSQLKNQRGKFGYLGPSVSVILLLQIVISASFSENVLPSFLYSSPFEVICYWDSAPNSASYSAWAEQGPMQSWPHAVMQPLICVPLPFCTASDDTALRHLCAEPLQT